MYIIDLEKYEDVEKQLEIKDEMIETDEEEFINQEVQRKDSVNANLRTDNSTVLQNLLRSVFISYITYG